MAVVLLLGQGLHELEEVRSRRFVAHEVMLGVPDEGVSHQVIHHDIPYAGLHDLAGDRRQGNRPVVAGIPFSPLLEYGGDIGGPPVLGNDPRLKGLIVDHGEGQRQHS